MRQAEVEILWISSFLNGLFLPPFPSSRRIHIRLRGGERRFFPKSAYPLCQNNEVVSKFAFETASL